MKTCSTCAYWKMPDDCHSGIAKPTDPDTYKPMKMPFRVRECQHPKLCFCERPVERNGFAVADGSTYMACLFTAEDFGCVRHEEAANE